MVQLRNLPDMNKIKFGIIFRTLGILLCLGAAFLLVPTALSFYYNEPERWIFLLSALGTLVAGALLACTLRHCRFNNERREGILIGVGAWVTFTLVGMLPFLGIGTSVTDAVFETVSGLTTTGATIYENIDELPRGILLWRSLLHWIGGIGIVVFTVAFLPMLNHRSGMLLFSNEVSGMGQEKLTPRISQTAKRLWLFYVVLTIIITALLYMGPMNLFDALNHAMSTISTGGFSTRQASIAYYDSPYTEYVVSIFSFVGGLNFAILYNTIFHNHTRIFKAEQLQWYTYITLGFSLAIAAGLYITGTYPGIEECFRQALFQVTTIITTTGFATADYIQWGPFFTLMLMLLMFFGACGGSTSGGAKIDRMVILAKHARNELYRVLHPNAIRPVLYNGKVLPQDTVSKVLSFTVFYVLMWTCGAVLLSLTGVTLGEAVGCSISCLSNAGPGLGVAGPAGTYAPLPATAKWILSALMLIGRLEIFTALVIFTPTFWRNS